MICLKSLIRRIVNLPKSEKTPAQILKILWFLFAVRIASIAEVGTGLRQSRETIGSCIAIFQVERLLHSSHRFDALLSELPRIPQGSAKPSDGSVVGRI